MLHFNELKVFWGIDVETNCADPRYRESAKSRKVVFIFLSLAICTVGLLAPTWCYASGVNPGEQQSGLYFAITHLPPAAYLILVAIFLLSVANLWFRIRVAGKMWPIDFISSFQSGSAGHVHRASGLPSGQRRNKGRSGDETERKSRLSQRGGDSFWGSGIVGIPRLTEEPETSTSKPMPTPLDGIDHPMPNFFETSDEVHGSGRILGDNVEKTPAITEFRFSASVDLPSPEELERREKEQLVVSGSVKGPDNSGLASVLVYLTDLEGKRVGQSCRSEPETGEFRVLVNEPGKYILNAHRRGHVLEDPDPLALPIESGKIEGYNLRMLPEGCIVQGKLISVAGTDNVIDLHVECVCRSLDLSRSVRTDSEGFFRISGVPNNSECFLEVHGVNGELLAKSEPFETGQKKGVYREIRIFPPQENVQANFPAIVNKAPEKNLKEFPKQA